MIWGFIMGFVAGAIGMLMFGAWYYDRYVESEENSDDECTDKH